MIIYGNNVKIKDQKTTYGVRNTVHTKCNTFRYYKIYKKDKNIF